MKRDRRESSQTLPPQPTAMSRAPTTGELSTAMKTEGAAEGVASSPQTPSEAATGESDSTSLTPPMTPLSVGHNVQTNHSAPPRPFFAELNQSEAPVESLEQ